MTQVSLRAILVSRRYIRIRRRRDAGNYPGSREGIKPTMPMPPAPATTRVLPRTRPLPASIAMVADSTAWFVRLMALTFSRYVLAEDVLVINRSPMLSNIAPVSLMCIVLLMSGGWSSGLYRERYIVGSLDNLRTLMVVTFVVWLVLAIVDHATVAIARNVVPAVLPAALILMGAVRLIYRYFVGRRVAPRRIRRAHTASGCRGTGPLSSASDEGGPAIGLPCGGLHR